MESKKFRIGKAYKCNAPIAEHKDRTYFCISRTDHTVTMRTEIGEKKYRVVEEYYGEIIYPEGKDGSLSPILSANDLTKDDTPQTVVRTLTIREITNIMTEHIWTYDEKRANAYARGMAAAFKLCGFDIGESMYDAMETVFSEK